jgi:branched-chain amino acid transport system ATP-binding protein/branched-chain amino acid transport system permease protein
VSARLRVARLRADATGTVVIAVLLIAGMVAVRVFGSELASRTYVVFLLNVMLVSSFQLFIGNSGIMSFGHIAFMGVGAYTTALITIPVAIKGSQLPELPGAIARAEIGLVPAVLVSALLAAVLAVVLGGGLIRMTESAMAMATLALLVAAHTLFQNWEAVTRGSLGLFGIPVRTTSGVAVVGAIAFVVLARFYKDSGTGLRLRATREDPMSSAAGGVDVVRTRFIAWVVSAAMMGAAGSLWAQSVIAFDANQFYFAATFATLAMLVIGGRTSVTGAVAGAAIVTFVSDSLARVEQGVDIGPWQLPRITGTVQFAIALLIIVMLVWRPAGLFDRWEIDDVLARLRLRRRRPAAAGDRQPESSAEPVARLIPTEASSDERPVLVVRNVGKRFEGVTALRGIDLTVGAAEILGLIGPNGSGKTTLLNVISGIFAPSEGEIAFLGSPIAGERPHVIANRGLARTFQNIRLFGELTVRENIEATSPGGTPSERVDEVVGWFSLADVEGEKAINLPYGMQRRLEIARAVVRHPRLVLLDEPAAGMNESESDELLANIRRIRSALGCSIVVVDHDLRLIMELCDRIQVLDQGQTIAMGAPHEVSREPAVVAAYLGGGAARTA